MNIIRYLYQYIWLTQIPQYRKNRNRKGNKKKYYDNMLKYKNIHAGKRCFIIATGPSLILSDLEMLKNEITIGMNSGLYLMDKCNWQPDYYISQDKEVYNKLGKDVEKIDKRGIVKFIGNTATENVLEKDVLYSLKMYDHLCGGSTISFSDDCHNYISDGWTVTYSAIQLAVYMGFKEIYLLGCDSNYLGKKHAIECTKNGKEEQPIKGLEVFKSLSDIAYNCAYEYTKKHDIKIFNATRGGMLEVFPRKQLEDILSDK